ncbi:heavy-metal-associated domain-containing protein [Candidatus Formimonas warabiya]|uniref:HMA domain-containing protein n=1 Tax=Formimonas warabiya TaxID=1761012 RepID=A0A3G1KMI3_FORW1|nr:hypothetical protein [Candidatus Formimonas warabiya]ATW23672.1 hypothetical protein DCMF_01670 [Candidatus Formimonas warabiya]
MSSEFRSWRVGGLDSNASRDHLQNSLQEMRSVNDVKVNISERAVSFSFNPEVVSENFIKHTINTLGYSVQENLTKE